ncbi:MAG: peptide chain release factor N(5)-glutamine methyltransferase [Fimbriimonadaceae bacterium]
MKVHDWVRGAAVRLGAAGVEASRLEAQVLAAHALGTDRASILAHPDGASPARADELLERRLAGEPLGYILGYREFYGRRFSVNPSVLIPRQETETIVEVALALAQPGARVLDVGTGSGCIAITMKLERPDLQVTGVDISETALATARESATSLGADVAFHFSDLFSDVTGAFDMIVSNPPYVAELAPLPKEVRGHEPALALFAGADGMRMYGRMAQAARPPLVAGGKLLVELGDGMGDEVKSVFEVCGWELIGLHPDLGGMPRVLEVRRRQV